MNGERRSLVKKELRAMAGTYVAVVGLVVCAAWAVSVWVRAPGDTVWFVGIAVSVLTAFLGAVTFAGEKQSGTIHFLTGLPVSRREIFKSKLASTAPVVLLLILLLTTVSLVRLLSYPVHPDGQWSLGWAWRSVASHLFLAGLASLCIPAVLYTFGLLFSLIVDTVVIATLGAIALFVIISALFTLPYTTITRAFPNMSSRAIAILVAAVAAAGIALAVAALFLARGIFCGKTQE